MAEYLTNDTELTAIANAIRTKGGTSAPLEYPDEFISAINNISGGGGVTIVDSPDSHGGTIREIITDGSAPTYIDNTNDVEYIDYDGTVVAHYSASAFANLSAHPANPTHEGLTAQGWNWTLSDAQAYVAANRKLTIGQMYVTTSGATEIDVEMHDGRLSPILTICVNGTITVDWGDGTTPDEVTGTSLTKRLAPTHTYTSAGNYTIKISKTSGTGYSFYGTTTYTLLRKNTTSSENRVYTNCVKKIRIGNGITSIGNNAFITCSSLASVTIPSSVTSIGTSAFSNCCLLSSVTLPSGVTSLGTSVFNGCYSLTSVTIPSSVTSLGSSVFNSCYSLTSVTIPSSVTSLGINIFNNCSSLASITLPSGLTSIGTSAFCNCSSLSSIAFPSGVTSIGTGTFEGCHSLASITLPSGLTSIGTNAFFECNSLASITLPSGVTSIGSNAFYNCSSLASITIPSGVTSIGDGAFFNCYSLASITLPSRVTSLGTSVFNGCYSLTSVTIQSGVTSIGSNAFYNCYSLASITLPSGLTSIDATAFYNCNSLASITIPNSVTSIGNSAFYCCYSLASITIPSGATSIDTKAFYSCQGIKEYHFLSTTPPTLVNTNAFANIPSDCVIYVPYSADHSILNAYQTETNWSTYASYMQEEPQ